MTTASPTKLRDGSWGVRVSGHAYPGLVVRIRTRGGKEWDAAISRVLWSGTDRDGGEQISICSTDVAPSEQRGSGYTHHRVREGTRRCWETGGRCYSDDGTEWCAECGGSIYA